MKNPHFSPDELLLDRVRTRAALFSPHEMARIAHLPMSQGSVTAMGADSLRISLPCPAKGLSRFNSLSLIVRNLSEAPLLVGMTLDHGTESSLSGLPPVSFSGGREVLPPDQWVRVLFPCESFGFYGTPRGWTDVRRIELVFGREKGQQAPREIRVALGPLEGERREVPLGPRLTERGLVKMLNAEHPAAFMLAPYQPGNLAMRVPPPHPFPYGDAEAILAGQIMGQHLSEPVAWGFNPLGAHEWTHFLNRHHFLRELVAAFARTGDERYAEALDRLIAGWIAANPVPLGSNGGAGPAWETLSTAWRLREWLWVAGVVWPSRAFSEATRRLMLRSFWEHARSLIDHRGHPGNWRMVEAAALTLAGICCPGFYEAPLWAAEGRSRLETECRGQFLPDGVHSELSPLYHAICLQALLEVKEAAQAAGLPLSDLVDVNLERATPYLAALCRPDFTWPSINDSGGAAGDYTVLLHKAGEIFGRSDVLWLGTRGRVGAPPPERSRLFPDAGLAVMRSGYGPRGNFLLFRAGPPGTAHVHDDRLSLEVTALGIPRLVDPGITAYAPGPLTCWYRSAAAHNVLVIDEEEREVAQDYRRKKQQSEDSCLFIFAGGLIEAAVGISRRPGHAGEDPGMFSRTVLFVNGEYWVVWDWVSAVAQGEVSTCWQFHPGRVDHDHATNTLRCVQEGGPGFEVVALPGPVRLAVECHGGSPDPPCGWVSLNGEDRPAPHFRCRWQTALPATVLWLLLPYEGTAASGVSSTRTDQQDGAICLDLRFPMARRDQIVFQPVAPAPPSQAGGAFGRIEVMRSFRDELISTTLLDL